MLHDIIRKILLLMGYSVPTAHCYVLSILTTIYSINTLLYSRYCDTHCYIHTILTAVYCNTYRTLL